MINIILKNTYDGAQFNNYVGFSQRGDDVTYNSQFVGGIAEDLGRCGKLSILTAFNYYLLQWVLRAGGTVLDLCSGPLNVAAGLEYRSESLIQANDILSELRLIGNGDFLGKQTNGRRYIKSAYWEVDLPLAVEQWSWPGLRALDFTYSERYDDYSTFGSAAAVPDH